MTDGLSWQVPSFCLSHHLDHANDSVRYLRPMSFGVGYVPQTSVLLISDSVSWSTWDEPKLMEIDWSASALCESMLCYWQKTKAEILLLVV